MITEYESPNYEARMIFSFLSKVLAGNVKNNPPSSVMLQCVTNYQKGFKEKTSYMSRMMIMKENNLSGPILGSAKMCSKIKNGDIIERSLYGHLNPTNILTLPKNSNNSLSSCIKRLIGVEIDTIVVVSYEAWDVSHGRLSPTRIERYGNQY